MSLLEALYKQKRSCRLMLEKEISFMKMKMFMYALALIASISACVKVQNYDSEDDFRVAPVDGGKSLVIIGYRGNKQFINIPPSIDGMLVTGIGEGAFADTEIVRITIPSSITFIDFGAFSRCYSLTSVTIPPTVTTIGNQAFSYCISLASITIPKGVTSIGILAFQGWTSSQTINVEGHANQASADAAWGDWRKQVDGEGREVDIEARIVYQGR